MTGKQKMGFFIIPNPERLRNDPLKYAKERERVTKWFHNIGRGWRLETFQFSKDKVLCEKHFLPEMFQEDIRARLMGYTPSKKLLKPDAVPTVFSHRPAGEKDQQASRDQKKEQRRR